MRQYHDFLHAILRDGSWKADRTRTGTLSKFGEEMKFDLGEGFPIVTTTKVWFGGLTEEVVWFLKGGVNIRPLVEKGVSAWTDWVFQKYAERQFGDALKGESGRWLVETEKYQKKRDAFEKRLGTDDRFARKWGNLGLNYGAIWRGRYDGGEDQIRRVSYLLKNRPDSRRMVVTAWHPEHYADTALPACHTGFQVWTRELSGRERVAAMKRSTETDEAGLWERVKNLAGSEEGEGQSPEEVLDNHGAPRRELSLRVSFRSIAALVAGPRNISQYALLARLLAHSHGMSPGVLTCQVGDGHIYAHHIEGVSTVLRRKPLELPELQITSRPKDPWDYTREDFRLNGYDHYDKVDANQTI